MNTNLNMETFKRKNDIGVNIEYTIIGYLKEESNYMIYTDFTTDTSNKIGIKLYVDKEVNGIFKPISPEEAKNVITAFNKELTSYKG